MSDVMIAVQHVFKSVTDSTGSLTILRDIDFTLNKGETAAIVGASGSGKSTLLSIVAGLDTPSSGTVHIDGVDLFALDEDQRAALRAQKVGFVFQSFQLLGNLTALENVMLPLELAGKRDARATATQMLQRVGLGELLFQQGHPARAARQPVLGAQGVSQYEDERRARRRGRGFRAGLGPGGGGASPHHGAGGGAQDKVAPMQISNQSKEPFMSESLSSPVASATAPSAAPIIAVEHVFKSVTDSTGTLDILRDIDFRLASRETAAIVGASGSGKSTLLSIIAGLDTPTRGTVRLDGHDLFAIDEDARAALRAQKVGFVFQSFQLMGNLTALENVMLPLELANRRDARKAAADMLARVGLGQRLAHYPKVLSGGEQQRVALARAFVVQPAVLLADEPTGSLDFATGETIMKLMFDLNREQGTTLVLVTHDRAIADQCERRITIEAGRVV